MGWNNSWDPYERLPNRVIVNWPITFSVIAWLDLFRINRRIEILIVDPSKMFPLNINLKNCSILTVSSRDTLPHLKNQKLERLAIWNTFSKLVWTQEFSKPRNLKLLEFQVLKTSTLVNNGSKQHSVHSYILKGQSWSIHLNLFSPPPYY